MRLTARFGDLARDAHVRTLAIGTVERIAWQSSTIRSRPSHDHPAIESTCKRHRDPLAAVGVMFQNSRKHVSQLLIIVFRRKIRLILPHRWMEIALLFQNAVRSENPRRSSRQK